MHSIRIYIIINSAPAIAQLDQHVLVYICLNIYTRLIRRLLAQVVC